MRDFVDALELALVQAAEREADRSFGQTMVRRIVAIPRAHAVFVSAMSAAAVVVALLVVSTSPPPSAPLAVLWRPAVDVSPLRPQLPVLVHNKAKFEAARAIDTPYGRGFVVPAPRRDSVCLAVPDIVPASYGQTCARVDQAERRGMFAMLVAPEGSSSLSEFVAVFPDGASRPEVVYRDGRKRYLELRDGVAAATFGEDVKITLRVDGTVRTLELPAHEPEGAGLADCGDGRVVPEPRGQTYDDVCRG
jgi:hypothetical protein